MSSVNIDLIFEEVIDALVPFQSSRRDYVTYLSQANRLVHDGDFRGLLDLLDQLQIAPPTAVIPSSVAPVTIEEDESAPSEEELTDSGTEEGEPSEPSDANVTPTTASTHHPRRRRVAHNVRYSAAQKAVLRHHFYVIKDHWPSRYMRTMLGRLMDVPARNIYFWFANERRSQGIGKPAGDVQPVLNPQQERQYLLQYRRDVGQPNVNIPMLPSLTHA